MPHWDYAGNGIYFITFVTKNRECILGEIYDEKMILTDFGKIVDEQWHKSFQIRNELFLDEYIIMPNHLHAIVVLDKTDCDDNAIGGNRIIVGIVNTYGRAYQQSQPPPTITRNMPIRKPKSLSSFVAGFKSAVNSKIDDWIDLNDWNIPKYNKQNPFFQSNYHDHIIRNAQEYERIKKYIANNPQNWDKDTLQTKGNSNE